MCAGMPPRERDVVAPEEELLVGPRVGDDRNARGRNRSPIVERSYPVSQRLPCTAGERVRPADHLDLEVGDRADRVGPLGAAIYQRVPSSPSFFARGQRER